MDANTEKMLYELEQEVETDAKLKTVAGWIEQQWPQFVEEWSHTKVDNPTAYSFKEWLINKLLNYRWQKN